MHLYEKQLSLPQFTMHLSHVNFDVINDTVPQVTQGHIEDILWSMDFSLL